MTKPPIDTYRSYGLSLWRWVSPDLELMQPGLQSRLDRDLGRILAGVGLEAVEPGEAPDLLLRYEAAPGVLIAELIDSVTNDRVWRTAIRGDELLADQHHAVNPMALN